MRRGVAAGLSLAVLGLALALLLAAVKPVTVLRPHGCPSGAPRAACFYPSLVEHRYTEYGLMGLGLGGLAGGVVALRSRRSVGDASVG